MTWKKKIKKLLPDKIVYGYEVIRTAPEYLKALKVKSQIPEIKFYSDEETVSLIVKERKSLSRFGDSELWVKDASYLRLKNIEIGYNFRLPFMPKIGMEKMRVFMTGYNLLTFDKLKISDPESMSSGVPQYPVMRVINFGLNVSF